MHVVCIHTIMPIYIPHQTRRACSKCGTFVLRRVMGGGGAVGVLRGGTQGCLCFVTELLRLKLLVWWWCRNLGKKRL